MSLLKKKLYLYGHFIKFLLISTKLKIRFKKTFLVGLSGKPRNSINTRGDCVLRLWPQRQPWFPTHYMTWRNAWFSLCPHPKGKTNPWNRSVIQHQLIQIFYAGSNKSTWGMITKNIWFPSWKAFLDPPSNHLHLQPCSPTSGFGLQSHVRAWILASSGLSRGGSLYK